MSWPHISRNATEFFPNFFSQLAQPGLPLALNAPHTVCHQRSFLPMPRQLDQQHGACPPELGSCQTWRPAMLTNYRTFALHAGEDLAMAVL